MTKGHTMKNKKTPALALPFSLLLSSLSSLALAANVAEDAAQGGYFKVDLGAVRFDLPGYKDGFGVVNLAPVSGPFLTKGENQNGEALTLTGGVVTQYPIDLVDGLLFFEGSAFYSQSDESYSTQLGSDSAGNAIRFGLFNGSNGYNSDSSRPLNYRLKSELEYLGGHLAVGVQHQAAGWNMRYQVGPQFLSLNQDYKLYGSNPSFATSFYNRHETLDTDYVGLRFAVSGDHALSEKLHVEIGLGLSALAMDADYDGTDDREFGGGSSLSRSLHETTYGADLKLALRYAFTPTLEVGLNLGLNYLDKVPEIVHATGATGNATFVPARLDTSHMLVQQTGIELRKLF
jgi:hypothetical protein